MAFDNPLAEASTLRILVPINDNEDSCWGIRYALRRQREGKKVEVILLHIGDPVPSWSGLRFRSQQVVAQFQVERGEALIEDAIKLLNELGISYRAFFNQGDAVFVILDVAEAMDCHEIAMPFSKKKLGSLLSRGVIQDVLCQQRSIPVVAVSGDGMPVKLSSSRDGA